MFASVQLMLIYTYLVKIAMFFVFSSLQLCNVLTFYLLAWMLRVNFSFCYLPFIWFSCFCSVLSTYLAYILYTWVFFHQVFFTLFTRGRLKAPSPRKTSLVFPLKINSPSDKIQYWNAKISLRLFRPPGEVSHAEHNRLPFTTVYKTHPEIQFNLFIA